MGIQACLLEYHKIQGAQRTQELTALQSEVPGTTHAYYSSHEVRRS